MDCLFLLPQFVVRVHSFCCSFNLPSSLRKNAKDWWCTKLRFPEALYKKKKRDKWSDNVTLALKERERGSIYSWDFHIRGGVRAFLGMGGERLLAI